MYGSCARHDISRPERVESMAVDRILAVDASTSAWIPVEQLSSSRLTKPSNDTMIEAAFSAVVFFGMTY